MLACELYKHLKGRFYLKVPLSFRKLQKQILSFAAIRISTNRSATQKEILYLNLRSVSNSFENIKVNTRFTQKQTRSYSKHVYIDSK